MMAPKRVDDENRPTCPVCHVRARLNGKHSGVQWYTCGVCLAGGSAETFEANALHKAERGADPDGGPWYGRLLVEEDAQPEDCWLCEMRPAMTGRGLCQSCAARPSNAKRKAEHLTETEKRSQARRAAMMLRTQGYVAVRLR